MAKISNEHIRLLQWAGATEDLSLLAKKMLAVFISNGTQTEEWLDHFDSVPVDQLVLIRTEASRLGCVVFPF